MRGVCQRCKSTVRSGQLYLVFDERLRTTIPLCVHCKQKESKEEGEL